MITIKFKHKIYWMISKKGLSLQLIVITLFFIILTTGLDIAFFNILLDPKSAIISIIYQFIVKIAIIMPLVYIILEQKRLLRQRNK